MLAFIFNQYDITFPDGGVSKSGFGVRRPRGFVFDEASIEALRLPPRRRGFRVDLEPIVSTVTLRGFRFPEELFGKKTASRRGFTVNEMIIEIDAIARRRGFKDERDLLPQKIPARRGFEVTL